MTTEPKLPPEPKTNADVREFWRYSPSELHAYGLQCFEVGRQQGMAQERALHGLAESSQEIEAGPQWQPIETAPKDGAWILLGYFPDVGGNHVIVACWDKYRSLWLTPYVTLVAEGHFSPTHWMNLPEPPKA